MKRIAAVLLLLAGCSKPPPPTPVVHAWGPLQSTLTSASRVEAFRLSEPENERLGYENWPAQSGPVAVEAAVAKELVDLLLDPKSFSDNPKPCEPRPGVRVIWTSGSQEVQAIFCFECSTLWLYSKEKWRDER